MCRFIAYIGQPVLLSDILFESNNSLIKQSIQARETEEPLNGDGFGLGWYKPEIDSEPALFTSIQPAWNDRNLMYLANKINSNCFFAHVRAASTGIVSTLNCHPFHYQNFLFMHNGSIGSFAKIKRYLRRELPDDLYDWIQGQTDSEHFFALFIDSFQKNSSQYDANGLANALEETCQRIEFLVNKYGDGETSYINAAITDGQHIITSRYVTDPTVSCPTLYYSAGEKYYCQNGESHMHPAHGANKCALIASEKLSIHATDWQEVPINYMLIIDKDLSISLREMQ